MARSKHLHWEDRPERPYGARKRAQLAVSAPPDAGRRGALDGDRGRDDVELTPSITPRYWRPRRVRPTRPVESGR